MWRGEHFDSNIKIRCQKQGQILEKACIGKLGERKSADNFSSLVKLVAHLWLGKHEDTGALNSEQYQRGKREQNKGWDIRNWPGCT